MPGILSYLRTFRHLASVPCGDGELLQRFREQRDEAAFATLVQRHGPMVLGIARRALGTSDLTDDVFQATFLVLARRGKHLETWPSVAGWLVQVARRTALQARAKSIRRIRHEQQVAAMTSTVTKSDSTQTADQIELAEMVDAELARLPSKYRTPLVLCQLQGQSREEAAKQLGWPVGSVSGRLARGKKLLQQRLMRKGLAPSLAAGAFAIPSTQAQVPGLLIQATTLLASSMVHRASTVSAGTAVTLAQGVMTLMLMTKLKYAGAAILLITLCVGTGVWAWPGKEREDVKQAQQPKVEPKTTSLLDQLQGHWVVEATNETNLPLGITTLRRGPFATQAMLSELRCWKIQDNQAYLSATWIGFNAPRARNFNTLELDTNVTPAKVDLANLVGIVRMIDGKPQFCFVVRSGPTDRIEDSRPKSFEASRNNWLVTLRRASDYDLLEGVWRKEERNPVTDDVESAEELIFRKNMYVRRNYNSNFNGRSREDRPRQFLLNETTSPKQIDLEIRPVDEVFHSYNLDNPANRNFFNINFPVKNRTLERQVGIYQIKDNDFTYLISGGIPLELETDKLVPNLKSPFNKRASSFVPGETSTEIFKGLPVTYHRVQRSLKDSNNAKLEPSDDPQVPGAGNRGETPTTESTLLSPKLTDLRQQRLKIAQERMDIWKEMYRAGRVSLEESGPLSQQLLDARLALAKDSDMKIKSLEEHLKLLKQFEEYAQKGYQSGSRTKSDLLAVQLRRVEVEIQLEELKAKR